MTKVKLTAAREVRDRRYKAGDVVDVHPSDARLLAALNAAVTVADDTPATAGDPVPDAVPGAADIDKDAPAADDTATGEEG